MRATLDEVEALTGSQIGFYHFVDPDQQNLSLQTWSTRTLADMCRTTGTQQHYPVSTAGIWVDCIHQRRPVIHNDYLSVPHRKGLPEGHAPVIREMAVPVIRGTLIVAVVGVGNKPTDFTSQDVDTIVSLADLAWDIAERKRTEIALQQSEGRLHDLIAANSDGMVVVDAEGIICYGNPAASDLLKIPHEELVGSSFGLPIVSEQSYEIDLLLPGKHTRTVEMRVSQLTWNDKLATLVALRDTTERKRLQRELLKHATTDDLTGISNRRHFLELAEQEMKRFIRYKQPLTVVIIDIDYFKQINDRFGHAAGDDALASFAKICQKNIREIDLLARFGGDEFVLLLPGADCDQAYQMIERLRLVLIGSPIAFSSSDHKLHLTFTAGIAEMLGDEDTLDTLLVRADQILYRLKETGRNRVGIETSLDADLKKLPNKLHLLASLEPPLTGPIEPLTR